MRFSGVVICGPGKLREVNQDNYYLEGIYREDPADTAVHFEMSRTQDEALCAVADGMGGERYGEFASLIAVSSMDSIDRSAGTAGLSRYLLDRNGEICRFMLRNDRARTGSTFVGLSIRNNEAGIVNIGDSRAYLFRDGQLSQLSQDHTPARQMVELGILTPEAARRHPDRHRLTQHLGIFPEELIIEPYTVCLRVRQGDLFLLCSDGLYDMLDDGKLRQLLAGPGGLRETARALFDGAMAAGGRDNITVLLVRAEPDSLC